MDTWNFLQRSDVLGQTYVCLKFGTVWVIVEKYEGMLLRLTVGRKYTMYIYTNLYLFN